MGWWCSPGELLSSLLGPTFLPLGGTCDPQNRPHSQKALSSCFSVWQICQTESAWYTEGPLISPKKWGLSMCHPNVICSPSFKPLGFSSWGVVFLLGVRIPPDPRQSFWLSLPQFPYREMGEP